MWQIGFEGDFDFFFEFLCMDLQFYVKIFEELLCEVFYILKCMDVKLLMFFNMLFCLFYGVVLVFDYIVFKYMVGCYVGLFEGSIQFGYYWVNIFKFESCFFYVLMVLLLYEVVFGYYLQMVLVCEQGEQLKFWWYDYILVFGEGWGFYFEFFGIEVEFYDDFYSYFG